MTSTSWKIYIKIIFYTLPQVVKLHLISIIHIHMNILSRFSLHKQSNTRILSSCPYMYDIDFDKNIWIYMKCPNSEDIDRDILYFLFRVHFIWNCPWLLGEQSGSYKVIRAVCYKGKIISNNSTHQNKILR